MVTQVTCPHCSERVDVEGDLVSSCPHCAGKLPTPGMPPPSNPKGGDLDDSVGGSTRVLGAGLEPVQTTYNLDRNPASEASFGGKVVDSDRVNTDNLKRPPKETEEQKKTRSVELEAARTQATLRRRSRMKKKARIAAVLFVVVLVVGAVVALVAMK